MSHHLEAGEDGILYSQFIGSVDQEDVKKFIEHITPYLENASANNPLEFIADAAEEGRWSLSARRDFTQLFDREERLGRVAIINANRFTRVVATFLMKATGRDGEVRFYQEQSEAVAWLKS